MVIRTQLAQIISEVLVCSCSLLSYFSRLFSAWDAGWLLYARILPKKKTFSGEGIPPLGHQQPSTSVVPYWQENPGLMVSSHGTNGVSENRKSLHHL
jgi:hypothetical protein